MSLNSVPFNLPMIQTLQAHGHDRKNMNFCPIKSDCDTSEQSLLYRYISISESIEWSILVSSQLSLERTFSIHHHQPDSIVDIFTQKRSPMKRVEQVGSLPLFPG